MEKLDFLPRLDYLSDPFLLLIFGSFDPLFPPSPSPERKTHTRAVAGTVGSRYSAKAGYFVNKTQDPPGVLFRKLTLHRILF